MLGPPASRSCGTSVGVGRVGDCLGLHGGVLHHSLEILDFHGPGLVGDRQALLNSYRAIFPSSAL